MQKEPDLIKLPDLTATELRILQGILYIIRVNMKKLSEEDCYYSDCLPFLFPLKENIDKAFFQLYSKIDSVRQKPGVKP